MTVRDVHAWVCGYLAGRLEQGWVYRAGWIDYRGFRCTWREDGSIRVKRKKRTSC